MEEGSNFSMKYSGTPTPLMASSPFFWSSEPFETRKIHCVGGSLPGVSSICPFCFTVVGGWNLQRITLIDSDAWRLGYWSYQRCNCSLDCNSPVCFVELDGSTWPQREGSRCGEHQNDILGLAVFAFPFCTRVIMC